MSVVKLIFLLFFIQVGLAKDLIIYKDNQMQSISINNLSSLQATVQSVLLPNEKFQADLLLPKNSSIADVFTIDEDIIITINLDDNFIKQGINEALLEKLSRIIDANLDVISPQSRKIHFATFVKGGKIALSNLLNIKKVEDKEPEQEAKLLKRQTNKSEIQSKGITFGPLSDKVIFISQGHGWIDYSDSRAWSTQRGITQDIVEDFVNAEAINQYLLEYLHNAGAKVFTMRERDLNNSMVIVDNQDGVTAPANGVYQEIGDNNLFADSAANGFKNFQSPYSSANDPFRDNGGSDRIITTSATETARAVWKPVIPKDGYYQVYVSYSGVGDRPTDAQYIVSHGGIETEILVNQEVHRYVWNSIGNFYFKAGSDDFIALTNKSSQAGTTVSADAIRIGGGMGDILGNNHSVISTHPRWEEGARTYVQYQGASANVISGGDVSGRSRFAAWENYASEDSIYVSWHSNASNLGSARGTSSYIYSSNSPDGTYDNTQAVPGSADLQAAIHDELINDIQADWQADWQNRGYRSAYFGEINPANNNEMPSVLLEMAFHDNVNDANALRNPQFRKLVSRSVYQGIVKYFATRDGLSVALLPEPPTHLKVNSDTSGQLKVSWHAPLIDGNNVAGDAATTYIVYKSNDGYNFDNGVETSDLFYNFDNQVTGQVYYIQVRAKNTGGLSLSSETLGARVTYANENRVLIINGFDRLNSGQLVYMNMPDIGGFVDRMFLRQMNSFDYVIQHGDAVNDSGVGFDSIANELIEDGLITLDANNYTAVIWILGEESSTGSTLIGTEQSQLSAYLNAGGNLFITGAEIAWDLDNLGSTADKDFYNNILMTEYTADDANVYQADGMPSSPFSNLAAINFDDGSNGTYKVEYPDVISPTNSAQTCMQYIGAQSACTYVDTGTYQVIHLGFPFETVYPKSTRNDVMAEVLNYFAIPYYPESIFSDSFE